MSSKAVKVRCPNGEVPDGYGNCWNVKLQVSLARGATCDPLFQRWIASLPGPLTQTLIQQVLKQPEARAAMKRIADANRRDEAKPGNK